MEDLNKIDWDVNNGRYVRVGLDAKNRVGCNVVNLADYTYDEEEGEDKKYFCTGRKWNHT